MPSSPRTPTGRRNSSGADIERPQSNGCSPKQSRRSSQYAASSPLASRSASSYGRHGGLGSPNGFASAIDSESSGGLGNLADELAEAFDEDDDQGLEEGTSVLLSDRTEQVRTTHKENEHPLLENGYRGLHPVNTTLFQPIPPGLSPSPAKQQMRFQNRRGNSQYDCSDYGEDSDLDIADGMSSSLEARLAAIESLVRRGTEANGSIADDIVQRVANHLKDLGSQSGVENSATRLFTAQNALTTHISHQTRNLLTLTHPLTSPLLESPDPELIDEIATLLTSLVSTLPTPTTHALASLHSLQTSTADLVTVLTYLSDTLHMMRQTTSVASRRLRTATEMVVELRREMEAKEEAVRWVEKGGWESRLAGRECARVCGEVVDGFEDVCDGWRERLGGGVGGVKVGVA